MLREAKISSIVSLFPLPQYVVVLQDVDKSKLVPIWIGVHEGNAIALEMQGEKFPRPLTHDLIVSILNTLDARVEKIVVSDLKDNSYFALIYIQQGGKAYAIDARPSDSLAVAVRLHCPIFIDQKVLDMCPEMQGPITQDEVEKFKESLKTLTPDEFFKKLEETPPAKGPDAADFGFDEGSGDGDGDDDEEDVK